ncbi:MAG: hypothetical protein QXU69_06465 [Thermofilaceae archaeon]
MLSKSLFARKKPRSSALNAVLNGDLEELRRGLLAALSVYGFNDEGAIELLRLREGTGIKNK